MNNMKSNSYNINRDYNPITGKYLQSDPIGLNAGINTYLYANGNPFYYIDEDGNMPSPPQGLVDFAAGFGDSVSFGGTKFVRKLFEIGSVNNCSSYYLAGELTDVAVGAASLGGSIYLKSLVKNWKTISPSVRNNINKHKPYQSLKEAGFDVHHIHPLKGHPGMPGIKAGQPTLFPTGGLPLFINSHSLNLSKVSNAEHIKLHLKLYKLEKFGEIYHSPITTGLKIDNSILNQCECK